MTQSTKSCPCSTYILSAAQEKKILLAAEGRQWKLYRKKVGKEYLIYCTVCHQWEKVSADEMEMILASHLCPMCFNMIKTGYFPKEGKEFWSRVMINVEDNLWLGYNICYYFDNKNMKPKTHYIRHEAVFLKTQSFDYCDTWVNGIVINMQSICHYHKEGWRYVRRKQTYYGYSGDYASFYTRVEEPRIITKKEHYMLATVGTTLKSNQIKFIKDGIFNKNQIRFIQAFNLNYKEDVLKYSKYMQEQRVGYYGAPIEIRDSRFNVFTLDYLNRNNIKFHDYIDYCRMLEDLGRKPDKPKDFWEAHNRISAENNIKKNEFLRDKIANRYAAVQKHYGYKKDNIEIKAMKDIEEVESVASQLHNCIARAYAKPYANGTTDVIYGTVDNVITFAIEVLNGKVKQLRMDCNKEAPDNIKKFVKKWAQEKNVAYV